MPLHSPNDRYIEELVYLHNAERTLLQLLPALQSATGSAALREVFHEEMQHASERHERVEHILTSYGIRTSPMRQPDVDMLVNEVHKLIEPGEMSQAIDPALASFVLRFVDQEMAGYRTAQACAEQIGDDYSAELLKSCLEDEELLGGELARFARPQDPPSPPWSERPRI